MVKKSLIKLIIPVSFLLFLTTVSVYAQSFDEQVDWLNALKENKVEFKSVSNGKLQEVVASWDGKNRSLISNNRNNSQQDNSGEYLVWVSNINGYNQVFRRHLPTDTDLQLTFASNNVSPVVDEYGNVAWERWIDDSWQIFLFDGVSIRRISKGIVGVRPRISGGVLFYAEKKNDVTWQLTGYSLQSDQSSELQIGSSSKDIKLEEDRVVFDDGNSINKISFSTVFDFYGDNTVDNEYTVEDVLREIESVLSEPLDSSVKDVTDVDNEYFEEIDQSDEVEAVLE